MARFSSGAPLLLELQGKILEVRMGAPDNQHPAEEDPEKCGLVEEKPGLEERDGVEEVSLVVPETDDTSLQALTFRTWTLGCVSCLLLSFLNMFFSLRKQQLTVATYCAQVLTLPLGRLMAAWLPHKIKLGRWEIITNPGPFNIKEHVLITVFANAGGAGVSAIHTITVLKAFYRKNISYFVALALTATTQLMGFGFAGPFRDFLVNKAQMWWPSNLVQVSLFRAMHEDGGRIKFFFTVMAFSFLYELFPGYLFTVLSSVSWVCYIWPSSVLAQQLGSGTSGLGFGAFSLDWTTIAGFLTSPLATPFFSIANLMFGFVITLYILVPLSYWQANLFGSQRFSLFSTKLFTETGQKYDVNKILTDTFQLNKAAYQGYGNVYLSIVFVFSYGAGFATLTAAFVHVFLFHGKELLRAWKGKGEKKDIHTRLMEAYKPVPTWWFTVILLVTLVISIIVCELTDVVQFRWWCVLLAAAFGFALTFPLGVIYATTNQLLSVLYIVAECGIGYLYPGRPMAPLLFRGYGTSTMTGAIHMLAELKLGHYMKIPPREMFTIQVLGTFVAATCYLSVGWWLFETIPHICDPELLPANSPWTCPHDTIFFDGSVVWGLVGAKHIFGSGGAYNKVNYAFLIGAVAPVIVWMLRKYFPNANWLKYVSTPIILSAGARMPYATAVSFWSWFAVGFVFNFYIFRYRKGWWKKYNYVISGAMDAGVAFMGVLLFFMFDLHNIELDWWGTRFDEQCPLAKCPVAPGIQVKGCDRVFGLHSGLP